MFKEKKSCCEGHGACCQGHDHDHDFVPGADSPEMNGSNCCGYEESGCCEERPRRHFFWKFLLIFFAILGLTAVLIIAIVRDRIVNQQFRQVTITGQGRVTYEPDIALVTLGVQIDKAPLPDEALRLLNDKVNGIISALKAAGVSSDDIQTQNYSLMPQYDYKNNVTEVGGYNANQQLTVKILGYDKDQNKLNRVIAAASKAGANQVLNLSFDVSNLNDLKQQARVKAIEDARSKSGAMAAAAGVELKDINNWWENTVQAPILYSAAMGAGGIGGGGGAPQVPSGSKEIIIEIGVTYNLK